MGALKTKTDLKGTSGEPKYPGTHPKAKFGVFGNEMVEKEVKKSGNSGRVYLPQNWVGKHVKIIRLDC
jgi:hypothetical protein